jgi:hypothetical protein
MIKMMIMNTVIEIMNTLEQTNVRNTEKIQGIIKNKKKIRFQKDKYKKGKIKKLSLKVKVIKNLKNY